MKKRPNIVMFISDQQRADTMPGVSNVDAHTPHLAWLTERSTTFRNAFCASPLCTPARGSILTGLYPHTNGIVANYRPKPRTATVQNDVKFLADYLKPQGYQCGYTGKWHLPTGDDRPGFSDFVTRLSIWDVDSPESDDALRFAQRVGTDIGTTYAEYLTDTDSRSSTDGGETKLPLAFHPSTLQAQQAATFVRQMKDDDRPFLLVYSCIEPHAMGTRFNVSPCPFDRMYDPAVMPLPATRRQDDAPMVVRSRFQKAGALKPTDDYSDNQLQELIAGYYGAVSYVDHLTGIILEALLETNQFDDTLFIFTSDHGEMLGDHRMLKKGPVMFEELIQIPLLIKPPGTPTDGCENFSLVSHVDLVPTILNYSETKTAHQTDGHNIRSLVEGSSTPVRNGVAVEFHSSRVGDATCPLRCWRTLDWKYVETIGGDNELYNLKSDPDEINNLIHDPDSQLALDQLRGQLNDWITESEDSWPNVMQIQPDHNLESGIWAKLSK